MFAPKEISASRNQLNKKQILACHAYCQRECQAIFRLEKFANAIHLPSNFLPKKSYRKSYNNLQIAPNYPAGIYLFKVNNKNTRTRV